MKNRCKPKHLRLHVKNIKFLLDKKNKIHNKL